MPQYNVSDIVYARPTPANLAIAITNSGGTSQSTIEEVIKPISLATGKINTDVNTNLVTGFETTFRTQFREGQYLYTYDASGNPELIGKIVSISNNTTLLLTEPALLTRTLKYAGSSQTMLRGSDNILIRIPVVAAARNSNGIVTEAYLPNWNEWRTPDNTLGSNGYNNPDSSNLVRYSNPGDVLSIDTTVSSDNYVQFTITPLNQFSNGSNADVVWNLGSIPNYIWAQINPYGDNGVEMSQNTMFYLFTKTVFEEGLLVTNNYSKRLLQLAGY
jgi:hypothetical protein